MSEWGMDLMTSQNSSPAHSLWVWRTRTSTSCSASYTKAFCHPPLQKVPRIVTNLSHLFHLSPRERGKDCANPSPITNCSQCQLPSPPPLYFNRGSGSRSWGLDWGEHLVATAQRKALELLQGRTQDSCCQNIKLSHTLHRLHAGHTRHGLPVLWVSALHWL